MAQLYDYPQSVNGATQNVAVFAFNGGGSPDPRGCYSLKALQNYYENVLGGNTPEIKNVVVQGPGNDPGPDTPASSQRGDSTGEVMLDMCVVGSVAPGAKIFINAATKLADGTLSVPRINVGRDAAPPM